MKKMRTYKRKTTVRPFTADLFNRAQELQKNGIPIRKIALELRFDEATIRKRLKKGCPASKLGRFNRTFNFTQEKEILEHCKILNKMCYGLSLESLRFLLFQYAEDNGIAHPFSKEQKAAGKDFVISFMRRHGLSFKKAKKISVARTMPEDQKENASEGSTLSPSEQDNLNDLSFLPNRQLKEESKCFEPTPGPSDLPYAPASATIPLPLGVDHHLAAPSVVPKGQSDGTAQEFNFPVKTNCASQACSPSSLIVQHVSLADIILFPTVSQRCKKV